MSASWPRTPVSAGSRIRIVAPSGPFDGELFERGVARLRTRYEVVFDAAIHTRHGYLAGDDERRLAELLAALDDPGARCIVAARGGYGATRLLDRLDPARVARADKLLVGFSDVTALHALWARAGRGSLHAPMAAGIGALDDAAFGRWVAALEGEPAGPHLGMTPLRGGRARGRLLGGNLAVLCALLGTPYLPALAGAVLFLEDVGERPYRVDRMLTSLRQAGALDGLAGVVLGGFSEAAPGPDGVGVAQVLAERLASLPCPVALGLRAGHIDGNEPLQLGRLVALDADAGRLDYL